MKPICAIGLMSGTSMDGIDVAALRSDGETIAEIGPGLFIPYAAPFRRYGNVVIIDHGGGWSSVITDLGNLRVRAGQNVRRGMPLGETGSGTPHVTVELRRDGRPVPVAQMIGG